jgi:phage terminase small subunit
VSKKKAKLTPRQAKLVKNLAAGMPQGKAAVAAGYSDKNPSQSAYETLQRLQTRMPEVMERLGLTDDALIEKHLLPLLAAEETKFFPFRKQVERKARATKKNPTPAPTVETVQVIEARNVAALGIRVTALDIACKLKGVYAPRQVDFDPVGAPPRTINTNAIPPHG